MNSYSEQCATKKSPVGGASAAGELQETLSTLKDAETGQRGYLLTGKEQYLVSTTRPLPAFIRNLKCWKRELETATYRARM